MITIKIAVHMRQSNADQKPRASIKQVPESKPQARKKIQTRKKAQARKTAQTQQKTQAREQPDQVQNLLIQGHKHFHNKDYRKAAILLERASNKGSIDATASLAYIYANGLGLINEDPAKARKLFGKAAEAGHLDSMYNLANLILLKEPLTQKLINTARQWLEKSARKGHAEAADSTAKIYEGNVNYSAALKWYQIAKKNGHPDADANIVSTQRKIKKKVH